MADNITEFSSPPQLPDKGISSNPGVIEHAQQTGKQRIGAVTNVLHTIAGTDVLVKDVAIYTKEKLSQAGTNLQAKLHDLEEKAKTGAISLAKRGVALALSPVGAVEGLYDYIAETPAVIKQQLAIFNEKVMLHHEGITEEKLTAALESARQARREAQIQKHHATQALVNREKLTTVRNVISNLK